MGLAYALLATIRLYKKSAAGVLGHPVVASMALSSSAQAWLLAVVATSAVLQTTVASADGDTKRSTASRDGQDELGSSKASRPLMREHPYKRGHKKHRRERRRMMVASSGQVSMASLGGELSSSPVVAEDVCPWFFDPPIHTNIDNEFRCYSGSCEEEDEDKSCCAKKGGTFQCSANRPYMCKRRVCDNDYCCRAFPNECGGLGGLRPCEGPPGHAGPRGRKHGPHGAKGPPGKVGAPGPPGDPVTVSVGSRGSQSAVSWTSLGCALALNVVMVLASIGYLIFSAGKATAKAPAEADGDEGYVEGEDDYQVGEGEDGSGYEEMPPEGGDEVAAAASYPS